MALPPVPAYAGSSARDYCVPARAGNCKDHQELEEVRCRRAWRELATRFFRSPLARPSRTGRENQLHPDESGSQRIVRAIGGLGVGLSSERPSAAKSIGRAVLCAPRGTQNAGAHSPRRARCVIRPTSEKHSRSVGRAVLCAPRLAQECEPYRQHVVWNKPPTGSVCTSLL